MSDIIGPMQSKIAGTADLLDLPAASAAALLRFCGWSEEKLTDLFWSDSEKVMADSGINTWKKSDSISTVGTATLPPSPGSITSCSSLLANPQGAGTQEGFEGTGGSQSRRAGDVFVLGLPSGYHGVEVCSAAAPKEQECRICFMEANSNVELIAAPCGHYFCGDCYHSYLATKIGEGPSVVFTTCPEHKCRCLIPPELWLKCFSCTADSRALLGAQTDDGAAAAPSSTSLSPALSPTGGAGAGGGGGGVLWAGVQGSVGQEEQLSLLQRYSRAILEQFVNSNKQMRWCPAPGCERIVMAGAGVKNVRCGPGGCGCTFCFKCGEEAHQPASCAELVSWVEKCQNESETANWILANTKRCPKCQTRIEKNQGCNHMTCSQCKYEFCWICMGNWTDHGANTGGYYKCNKFDASGSTDSDDEAGKAKRELDRYLHYFKRYQAHHQAQLFAQKQLQQTEKKMGELQESTGSSSWIDVQFLKNANEMVIDCRRTLKYTYVFGYYLTSIKPSDNDDSMKHRALFENMQEDLERYTEILSELTEMPIERMTSPEHRESIINNARVVERFLKNLLSGCDDGLDEIGKGAAAMHPMTDKSAAAAEDNNEAALQAAISESLKPKSTKK